MNTIYILFNSSSLNVKEGIPLFNKDDYTVNHKAQICTFIFSYIISKVHLYTAQPITTLLIYLYTIEHFVHAIRFHTFKITCPNYMV